MSTGSRMLDRGGRELELSLVRASVEDGELIWEMQIRAFKDLLEKYRDLETSPGNEPLEKVLVRLRQPETFFYLLKLDRRNAGAIRVVDRGEPGKKKRISPLFVLPEFRNMGPAQAAIREVERLHGSRGWELDTILQEKGNCHLYEKMGYHQTGETRVINENMTLVYYEK